MARRSNKENTSSSKSRRASNNNQALTSPGRKVIRTRNNVASSQTQTRKQRYQHNAQKATADAFLQARKSNASPYHPN